MSEDNTARQATVRRAEIRKLVEEVQRAVARGQLRFGAALDRIFSSSTGKSVWSKMEGSDEIYRDPAKQWLTLHPRGWQAVVEA